MVWTELGGGSCCAAARCGNRCRESTFLSTVPVGRIGEPEELVGTIIYFASDASEYVTGVCLPVDGGFLSDGV